jgi:large subunit ribosomal protein L9
MLKRKMQVILMERVEKLGQMGQIVTVSPGYARNFLLPKKKAQRATKENIAQFDIQKAQLEATNLKLRKDAEFVAKSMDGAQIVIIRQASEVGQLYGSVRSRDISEGLTKGGFTVDKSQIIIEAPIKNLGVHTVFVSLHPEVRASINLIVAQSEEEAALKANQPEEEVPAA